MELNIGSFNIASSHFGTLEELATFIENEKLDIIGLQEVDQLTQRKPYDMAAFFEKRLKMHSFFSEAMPFDGGSYGVLTLSKYPFEKTSSHLYKIHGEEPRVFQEVVVRPLEKSFTFINTHLSFETIGIRQQQMAELMAYVKEKEVVIVGDFNTDQRTLEWADFNLPLEMVNGKNEIFLDTFLGTDDTMKTNAIDNILYSTGFKNTAIQVVPSTFSDHALLRSTFEF